MGIIATKKDDTLYSYFLKFEAINYWIFTLYVYGLKWGYVWHDAGPVFGLPIKQNGYLNMILFVYHGVGYYLWKASNDIDKYKEVLSMNTTCLIGLHLFSMCFNMVSIGYDNDLGFLGPYTFIAGIPPNFSPIGDVFVFVLFLAINVFFFKRKFGTFY